MPLPQRFSFNPDPATQGGNVEICYDFSLAPAATSPVTVEIDYGTGDPEEVELSTETNCVTKAVPANCESIVCEDESGQSEDGAVAVEPPP